MWSDAFDEFGQLFFVLGQLCPAGDDGQSKSAAFLPTNDLVDGV
jgi:hypothetical protein